MIYNPKLIAECAKLIEEMETKNTDLVIAIYGNERTGKSTFAANLIKILDPTFTPETLPKRTCLTFEDFARIAPSTPPKQAVWCDEFGWYSKRGAYDSNVNRVLLQYFQEAGGSRRIYILCFPELQEIDRKVIQRSRLFFETVRKNGQYLIRGWTKNQIEVKVREMRLPSPATRIKLWAGVEEGKIAQVFRCDYKDIEDIMEVYKGLKALNLARTDLKLKEHCNMSQREFALQLQFDIKLKYNLEYSSETLRKSYIRPITKQFEEDMGEDSGIFRGEKDVVYKDEQIRDQIKNEVFKRMGLPVFPQIPQGTNIIYNSTSVPVTHSTESNSSVLNEFTPRPKGDVLNE